MKCPECGLSQHYKTRYCACGYEFEAWRLGLYSADQGAERPSRTDNPLVAESTGMLPLLRSIWLSPRRTISVIARENSGYLFYALAPIPMAGLFLSVAMAYQGDYWPDIALVGMSLVLGLFCGPLLFILLSFPVHLVFKLLGGKGSPKLMRTCFAWSSVPFIPALLVLIPMAIFGPNDLFSRYNFMEPQTTQTSGFWSGVHIVYSILGEALGVWSMVIMLVGVSETEKISKIRVLLGISVILLVTFVVFFLLGSLSVLFS